jgi:hypothetical protein
MLKMNWMRGPMRAPEGEGSTPAATTPDTTSSPAPSPTPPTTSEPTGVNNLLGNDPKNPARDPGEAKPPAEGEPKPGEKPAEGDAPKFDAAALKPPEGVEKFDDGLLEKLGPVAEKHGLTTEAAQDLVNLHFDILKQAAQAPYQAWDAMQTKWVDQVKADPELKDTDAVAAAVGKVFDNPSYGDPEVRKALILTGAGNNPAIIRTFYRMAKALNEGGPVAAQPGGDKPPLGARAMYPHLKQG